MRGTTRDVNAALLCKQQASITSLEDHVTRLLVVLSQKSGVSPQALNFDLCWPCFTTVPCAIVVMFACSSSQRLFSSLGCLAVQGKMLLLCRIKSRAAEH